MHGNFKDISNRRFGRLVAKYQAGRNRHNRILWFCICDCGNKKKILGYVLLNGKSKSCGCLMRELTTSKNGKHGHAPRGKLSPTYNTWLGMIQRCTNPKMINYKYYGARGIKFCDSWRDFRNFLQDMGERPEGRSLDRYPNPYGNYEPGNCRWATRSEQRRNQRQ